MTQPEGMYQDVKPIAKWKRALFTTRRFVGRE
jgi:hypothetical protein